MESVLLPQDMICGSKRFVRFKGKAAWIDRSDRTSGCSAFVSSPVNGVLYSTSICSCVCFLLVLSL